MEKNILNRINNISIYNKLLFAVIVGAIIPVGVMMFLYTLRIYNEYNEQQQQLVDNLQQRVEGRVSDYFNMAQDLSVKYSGDLQINDYFYESKTMDEGSKRFYLDYIESQIKNDMRQYSKNIDAINLYLDTSDFNDTGGNIHPLSRISDQEWFTQYVSFPQYLVMTAEIDNGNVTVGLAKTINSVDYFAKDIVHVTLDAAQIEALIQSEMSEAIDSQIFLLDDKNQIIASSPPSYGVNANTLIQYEEADETIYTVLVDHQIGEALFLKDWKLLYQIDNRRERVNFWQQLSFLVIGSLMILSIMYAIHYYINSSIVRRLQQINRSMSMAEQEIFEPITDRMGEDEVGETAGHYNAMIKKIKGFVYEDGLTGLMNRQAIVDMIHTALERAEAEERTAVMFLDVDNFKFINDTYGHDLGDEVIIATANRLMSFKSDHVHIGRFGGDEFIIIVEKVKSRKDIKELAESVRVAFSDAITVSDLIFHLTISLGLSMSPDNGLTAQELIKKADLALYDAKDGGRNRLVFYRKDMDLEVEERFAFQNLAKKAFQKKEFYLNYQPYFDTEGVLVGFEALIRWYSTDYGQVNPARLIESMESMGLIIDLGKWVMKQAMQFAASINLESGIEVTVAVNISALQLLDPSFFDDTMETVKETGVDPCWIVLEMTESVLIESIAYTSMVLDLLRNEGFGIAIDDFGTGYSSLEYLKKLPVTILKIDRSFISSMDDSEVDRGLVSIIIALAHKMSLRVVAEGVETEKQVNMLRDDGCDLIQGYYLGKPSTEAAARKLLREKTGEEDING